MKALVVPRQTLGHCPLCGRKGGQSLGRIFDDRYGEPGLWNLKACANCGAAFLGSRPRPSALSALYGRYYYSGVPRRSRDRRLSILDWAYLVRAWAVQDAQLWRWARTGERVADVGAGAGWPNWALRRWHLDYTGIEMTAGGVAAMRQGGLNTFHGGLDEASRRLGPSFDLVCMSQVLEHLPDPVQGLRLAAGLMAPGGRLLVACPNWGGRSRAVSGMRWINLHAPYHLVHFTKESLRAAAAAAGLRVLRLWTLSPVAWLAFQKSLPVATRGLASPAWQKEPGLSVKIAVALQSHLDGLSGRGDCLLAELTR